MHDAGHDLQFRNCPTCSGTVAPVCKRENLERLYQSGDVIGDVVVCLCPLTQARTTLIAQLHEWGAEMCNCVSNYHVRLHHHVDQAFLIFLCTVKT